MSRITNPNQKKTGKITMISKPAILVSRVIRKKEAEKSWLIKYSKENPMKITWIALLTFGGGFLLIFFLSNHFLPDVKLEDASTILVSMALVSLFTLSIIGLIFVLPAFLLRSQHESGQINLQENFQRGELALAGCVVISIAVMITKFSDVVNWNLMGYAFVFGLALLFFLHLFLPRPQKCQALPSIASGKECKKVWVWRAFISCLRLIYFAAIWGISGFTALFPLLFLDRSGESGNEFWFVSLLFMAFSFIVNGVWAARPDKFKWSTLFALIILVIIALLSSTSLPTSLPKRIADTLAFGSIENVSIVLKKDACFAFNFSNKSVTACVFDEKASVGIISNIKIVSRIGSEILLRDDCNREFILPKGDVLMWSRPASLSTPTPAGSASSASKVESIKTPVVCANNKASSPAPIASSPVTSNTIVINQGNQTTQVQISAEFKSELINTIQTSIKNEIKNIHKHAPKKTKPSACTPATKSTCVPLQCQVAAQCAEQHPPLTQ